MSKNTKTIKSLIDHFYHSIPNSEKLILFRFTEYWNTQLPSSIKSRTKRIYIKSNTIIVELTSDVLRKELDLMKSSILDSVKKYNDDLYDVVQKYELAFVN